MRRRWLRVLLSATVPVGLTLVLGVATAYACTALATVNVTQAVAYPGTVVDGAAANFYASGTSHTANGTPVVYNPTGSPVVIHWNAVGGPALWTGQPDAGGRVAFTFTVPSAAPGDYVIVATQADISVPAGGSTIARAVLTIPGTAVGHAPPPVAVPAPVAPPAAVRAGSAAAVKSPPVSHAHSGLHAVTSGGEVAPVAGAQATVPNPVITPARTVPVQPDLRDGAPMNGRPSTGLGQAAPAASTPARVPGGSSNIVTLLAFGAAVVAVAMAGGALGLAMGGGRQGRPATRAVGAPRGGRR